MELKFIVDECLGTLISNWLKQNNFDVISVIETMPGKKDTDILNIAFAQNRILITNDKDFGDIVFQKNYQHCGIILLRLKNYSAENKIKVIKDLFDSNLNNLFGNFIVVTDINIKIVKQNFN